MDWNDFIPEADWIPLPSGGAIGRDSLGPCVLRTSPEGGWGVLRSGEPRALDDIGLACAQVQHEAQVLLGAEITGPWDLQKRSSFMPFRLGLSLPRAPSNIERKVLPVGPFVVTDEATDTYNCRGSAFGRLKFHAQRSTETVQEFMMRMGCRPLDGPSPGRGIVLALHEGSLMEGCHVARCLRDDWYESKCGPYLRIVHKRLSIEPLYGKFLGYWLLDEEALDRALEQEAMADSPAGPGAPTQPDRIDDSLVMYGAVLSRMLDEIG